MKHSVAPLSKSAWVRMRFIGPFNLIGTFTSLSLEKDLRNSRGILTPSGLVGVLYPHSTQGELSTASFTSAAELSRETPLDSLTNTEDRVRDVST
jgi:hypothetical protein